MGIITECSIRRIVKVENIVGELHMKNKTRKDKEMFQSKLKKGRLSNNIFPASSPLSKKSHQEFKDNIRLREIQKS